MRFLMKFSMPNDSGNELLADPNFGEKLQDLMKQIKAEAAYFTSVDGQRGGYIFVSINDASEIAVKAEPFFVWLKADVEMIPVMQPEDLMKAGPSIASVFQKYQ